jgi:hypothetical protein
VVLGALKHFTKYLPPIQGSRESLANMVLFSLLLSGAAAASASAIHRDLSHDNSTSTVVNLGSAGSYQGVTQNEGTYVMAIAFPLSLSINAYSLPQCDFMEGYSICRAASRETTFYAT